MSLWFAHKNSELSSPPISLAKLKMWKERAGAAFWKINPALEVRGALPHFLKCESTATKEWLVAALRSNTGQDRICAMAYLINAYPTRCLRYLDAIISTINPAKQRDCFQSIDALHQLWDKSLLPKNRCLIALNCRPFEKLEEMNSCEMDETLSTWFFEAELKERYFRFVKALEHLLMADTVESFKRKAIGTLSHLLSKSPENRSLIISAIVNKLGDRSKVLASCIMHKLREIVGRHDVLLDAIVDEVRSFLFRPNLLPRAKYYGISLLSCLPLKKHNEPGKDDSSTAVKLIKIYAAFFHATVKLEEIPERLATALLTGLSRAAPFLPDDGCSEYFKEVNDIFRLVHTSSFNVSLQALAVLYQLSSHRPEIRDRYYQAFYRKLLDKDLLHTSRGPTVLHLLYRSMLSDPDMDRQAAFAQRLLQLCLVHSQPGFVVGSLILLSKVQNVRKHLIVNSQISIQTENIGLAPATRDSDSHFKTSPVDEDEDEHFSDAPDSDNEKVLESSDNSAPATTKTVSTWEHKRIAEVVQPANKFSRKNSCKNFRDYNPDAREPLFARAAGYPSWPLVLLSNHAHPSVSLLAKHLLTGEVVSYTGNPFDDFSTVHFLDRFAYKKPKCSKAGSTGDTKKKLNPPPGRSFQRQVGIKNSSRAFPVNSALFRQMVQDRVPVDEQFFHKYFKFLEARHDSVIQKSRVTDDSDDSVSDEEFDAYLEKYERGLIPSGPDVDDEDDIKFDDVHFSDHSSESAEQPNSDDEAAFSAMDGTPNITTRSKKQNKNKGVFADSESDVNLDDITDDEIINEGSDQSDTDDNTGSSDADKSGMEYTSSTHKAEKLSSVFASAEEVGQLYRIQETPRERKQRLWEEKRSEDGKYRSRRRRGGNNRHGSALASRRSSKSESKKNSKGKFKSFHCRTEKSAIRWK